MQQGLVQSEANSIIQDNKGFIWIGTFGGVSKFDGQSFSNYTTTNGLPINKINTVYEDSKGQIWFGTMGGGACFIDNNRFRYLTVSDGLPSDYVNAICEDHNGNIWIGTNEGICRFNGRDMELFSDINGDVVTQVSSIIETKTQEIYLTTLNRGVFKLQENKFVNVKGTFTTTYHLFEDSHSTIWISAQQGYSQIKGDSIINGSLKNVIGESRIEHIMEDSDGNYWFSSYGRGVCKWDGANYKVFNSGNGLCGDIVYASLEDREGNYWIATYGGGVCVLESERFVSFRQDDGLVGDIVLSIGEHPDGSVWFGTLGGGLTELADGELIDRSSLINVKGATVWKIFFENDGTMWLASNHGMTVRKGEQKLLFNHQEELLSGVLYDILEDDAGNKWIATEAGLNKIEDEHLMSYAKDQGLSHVQIRPLMQDKNGELWVGTYGGGLFKQQGSNFIQIGAQDGLGKAFVSGIVQDDKGIVWFSTIGHGLVQFDPERGEMSAIRIFNTESGLNTVDIMSLALDDQARLWLGTNRGAAYLDLKQFYNTGKPDFTFFGTEDGFHGLECSRGAIFVDSKQNVWFGTIDGVVRFNPREDKSSPIVPAVYISNIKVFQESGGWEPYSTGADRETGLPLGLNLPYNKSHLTVCFSGITFSSPEKVRYSYLLQGSSQDEWSNPTATKEVTFPGLRPGTYIFKVKAISGTGVESEVPAVFKFNIEPPFWQTWWFYLFALLGIAALFYTFTKLRTKGLHRSKQTLEEQIKLRTKELIEERDEKDLLLKEIHHRVKNNLQVISSLINLQSNYIDDKRALELFEECQNRIKSMALVHEKMYESTDLANINIRDYITMLTDNLIATYGLSKYISLDIQLSSTNFGVDTISPLGLLLNEIISNSLKHGFEGRDQGKIIVQLEQVEGQRYKLIIGDNGIGMPDELLHKESGTLGMDLIRTLVDQLDGTIERVDRPGTVFRIIFTALDKQRKT